MKEVRLGGSRLSVTQSTAILINRVPNRSSGTVFKNPAAESTAQGAFREETQFYSLSSYSPSVGTSRFSQNTHSIHWVMREHTPIQNRAALDLISKLMDNIKGAFIGSKRVRDQFHEMLSISAQSDQSVRQRIEADSLSAHRAEKETAEDQRRIRSQVLVLNEYALGELCPSNSSTWAVVPFR